MVFLAKLANWFRELERSDREQLEEWLREEPDNERVAGWLERDHGITPAVIVASAVIVAVIVNVLVAEVIR